MTKKQSNDAAPVDNAFSQKAVEALLTGVKRSIFTFEHDDSRETFVDIAIHYERRNGVKYLVAKTGENSTDYTLVEPSDAAEENRPLALSVVMRTYAHGSVDNSLVGVAGYTEILNRYVVFVDRKNADEIIHTVTSRAYSQGNLGFTQCAMMYKVDYPLSILRAKIQQWMKRVSNHLYRLDSRPDVGKTFFVKYAEQRQAEKEALKS